MQSITITGGPGQDGPLNGDSNTAVGYLSMGDTTGGAENAAFGMNSLADNTTGMLNAAMGLETLLNNTTGAGNAALGADALEWNTTGINNTGVGQGSGGSGPSAGNSNQTGSNNTFVGSAAMPGSTTQQNYMTVIGASAVGNCSNCVVLGRVGIDNVGIGTTSPGSTLSLVGTNVDPFDVSTSTSGSLFHITQAGNVGIGTTSPQYLLQAGNSSISGIVARFQNANGTCDVNPTTNTLACSSDERLKKDITPMGDELSEVMALQPVYFNWNAEASGTPGHPGFIAQQVQQVMPEVVSTDPTTGLLSIGYSDLVPAVVSAMQQMQSEMTTLQGGLSGNATAANLTVYTPSNFSGNSVGEAEIPAGQTSVRVSFSQAYQYQPIITATPLDFVVSTYRVTDIDGSGFTIQTLAPVSSDTTFDWHSFASPNEQLTVSDGTTQPIVLVVASSTPASGPLVMVISDSTDSSSTSQTDLGSPSTSTPAVLGTSTPASTQAVVISTTTTSSLASFSVPSVVTPTPPPAPPPPPTTEPAPLPAPSVSPASSPAVTAPSPAAGTSAGADSGLGSSTQN
jgi:hypothetical protein